MKRSKTLSIFAALVLLVVTVIPASAQLGDTDGSNITIQNVSTSTATVTVSFISEGGTTYTPTDLGGGLTNPFTLNPGENALIYVPNIPSAQLPSGQRYAVVVSSTAQVVATVGVFSNGTKHFHGIYSGFSSGATTLYIPNFAYNWSPNPWYAMISVQNLGSGPADVTVTIYCTTAGSTKTSGTLSVVDLPSMASKTWALKNTLPSGWSSSDKCHGSAVITSDQPVVAVNNQNIPSNGKTNSFEAYPSGAITVYVPNLLNNFSNWNSALNIQKIGSGSTTVTVTYTDGDPNDTCNLSDITPSCQLYMPTEHTQTGSFGATVTSSSLPILINVGQGQTTYATQSGYMAFLAGSGTASVFAPLVTKYYSGWVHQINCQNIGSVATTLTFNFEGGYTFGPTASVAVGDVYKLFVPSVGSLPNGYAGSVTVTANAGGAEIACTVGGTNVGNQPTIPGDWGTQYNAFNQ